MATVKQVLDKHFFSFLDENGLESLKEKMIETITKAEYEISDFLHYEIEEEATDLCHDYEIQIKYLKADLYDLMKKHKEDDFFIPKTIQDEFKLQWIKDNWDTIPSM
jgi:hypothetical protein